MATVSTIASSREPGVPFLSSAIPVSSAIRPLALESISGRTPPARAVAADAWPATRLATPAALVVPRNCRREIRGDMRPLLPAARGSGADRIYQSFPCTVAPLIYNSRLGVGPGAPRARRGRMPIRSKWESLPTEAINPATLAIDKLPAADIVELMMAEDRKVVAAVQREKERIALGAEMIAESLKRGGRVVFVGAGTSGRLGVLESAEMPPTFGTDQTLVQAVMAGGRGATFKAKEGIEDNYEEGARSVTRQQFGKRDVVVGVSASGMTPFVRGALTRARKAGAKIIFVTCWPGSELQTFVDLQIAPAVGPELIAGSTRLKAGTATKMVLNMLTTVSMIKVGKTYGNLMVDVQTGSEKLKDRARRIVSMVTGIDYDEADAVLKSAKFNVKAAIVMQKAGLSLPQALRRLKKADDSVRKAIGEDVTSSLKTASGA